MAKALNLQEKTANLLCRVLERGKLRVTMVEVAALAEEEGIDEEELYDALLDLEGVRAMVPVRSKTGRGLAWEHRALKVGPGEELEVPIAVYYAFEGLLWTGRWSYEYAAQRYFEAIREVHASSFTEALKVMVSKTSQLLVDAELIKTSIIEVGLPESEAGVLISELKGGGFISPLISMSQLKPTAKGPYYELNPALFRGAARSKPFMHA